MKKYFDLSFCALSFACVILVAVVLSGCGGSGMKVHECNIPVDSRLVSANSSFSFDLFKELLKEDPGKNVFISPTSVSLCLSMIRNGAAGTTQDAIAHVLGVSDLGLPEANIANQALIANLEAPGPGVTIDIANSIWASKNYTFKPDFLKTNQDYYAAGVTNLDFSDPAATDTINKWVSDHTEGKIPKLYGTTLDPNTIIILVNAIYFHGTWTHSFDASQTSSQPFTCGDGSHKNVQMMSQMADFVHLKGNGFEAISLPYGSERVSMYIFLPDATSDLNTFLNGLTAESWASWMDQMQASYRHDMYVYLPKFTIEYGRDLNDALKALGMGVAFTAADFSNMTDSGMSLDKVVHKAFVQVDEKGTTAAAATGGGGATSAPEQFMVDRPFFFAIRDNKTGEILFMGCVVNP